MNRRVAGCLSAGVALALLTVLPEDLLGFPLEKWVKGNSGQQDSEQKTKEEPRIVAETMDSGDYTYMKVKAGDQVYWLAAPQTKVKVGDQITHSPGVTMYDFESRTLKRRFETILFVDRVRVVEEKPSRGQRIAAAHRKVGNEEGADSQVTPGSIRKAEGGYTVAELYQKASSLEGKQVSVRGKVVKYNGAIMGRNWIHLRDGTGKASNNDITVTTTDKAKVGDLLLVVGKLAVNKDFGSGYTYPVIIEDAELTSRE